MTHLANLLTKSKSNVSDGEADADDEVAAVVELLLSSAAVAASDVVAVAVCCCTREFMDSARI